MSGVSPLSINSTTLSFAVNDISVGKADINACIINVGAGATGNRASYIDFIGDTTYTDYGLRIGRSSSGANGPSELLHRGTGTLSLTASDAGSIALSTSNTQRLTISSAGDVVLANDAGPADIASIGFRGIPSNEQTGASYTLALTDAGKAVIKKLTGSQTITIPATASVNFPIGTTIVIDYSHPQGFSATANSLTITPASDVGIIGASGANKDVTGTVTSRFKDKLMTWPSQVTLRKLRNKGSATSQSSAPAIAGTLGPFTVTFNLNNHGYQKNDFVVITGGDLAAIRGTHRIFSTTTNSFTYQVASSGTVGANAYSAAPADLWVITGDFANSTTA